MKEITIKEITIIGANFVIMLFSLTLTIISIIGQYTFTLNGHTKDAQLWIFTSIIFVLSAYLFILYFISFIRGVK